MVQPLTLSPGLPVVGELRYGNVRFEELLKSKMTGRPEWDRARRVVKYVMYTLEVDGYVLSTDSQPNDPTWANMRHTLQQPGLTLTYSDRGFGIFTVNKAAGVGARDGAAIPTGLVDVCNGPKPELLQFTPMGARLAAHILWKCEICLPEIRVGGFQSAFPKGVLAFNWETSLTFGDDGYAEYTVDGELEIARVFGVPDNLEQYRPFTEPQLPVGFKPTQRTFKMDDAKRKITFTYSFKELPPMGLPIRCTKAGGSYTVSCVNGPAMVRWTANLQASYTTVPTGPRREAYIRFLGLWIDRMGACDRNTVLPTVANGGFAAGSGALGGLVAPGLTFNGPGTGFSALSANSGGTVSAAVHTGTGQVFTAKGLPIIRKFVINEGLYEDSKSSSFECSWEFTTTFRSIFAASGAWRKMDECAGQNFPNGRDAWVSDMAEITGYNSWYRYGFRPQSEVVVSPNLGIFGPMSQGNKQRMTGATFDDAPRACTAGAGLVRSGVDPDSGTSPDAAVRIPGLPSPEASWLEYQIDFITDLDTGMVLHKTLPQSDDLVDTLSSVDVFATNPESNIRSVNTVSNSSGQDVLQRMSTSTYRVVMRGYGKRAGYKVPVPDLKVFGGSPTSPVKQRVIGPRIVANYSGIPIYMTAWMLWYDVPVPPRAHQNAPPNLAEHIGDVANPPKTIQVPVSVPEPPIMSGGRLPPTLQPIVPVG